MERKHESEIIIVYFVHVMHRWWQYNNQNRSEVGNRAVYPNYYQKYSPNLNTSITKATSLKPESAWERHTLPAKTFTHCMVSCLPSSRKAALLRRIGNPESSQVKVISSAFANNMHVREWLWPKWSDLIWEQTQPHKRRFTGLISHRRRHRFATSETRRLTPFSPFWELCPCSLPWHRKAQRPHPSFLLNSLELRLLIQAVELGLLLLHVNALATKLLSPEGGSWVFLPTVLTLHGV